MLQTKVQDLQIRAKVSYKSEVSQALRQNTCSRVGRGASLW